MVFVLISLANQKLTFTTAHAHFSDTCSETDAHHQIAVAEVAEVAAAAAVMMYGRCKRSGMDAGDGSVGLWLIVSLVPPRFSKVPDLANKSRGGCERVALTRGMQHMKVLCAWLECSRFKVMVKVNNPNIPNLYPQV